MFWLNILLYNLFYSEEVSIAFVVTLVKIFVLKNIFLSDHAFPYTSNSNHINNVRIIFVLYIILYPDAAADSVCCSCCCFPCWCYNGYTVILYFILLARPLIDVGS
ncbi:hypothetical protein T492DRAFT_1059812 [Pavlovales sp. CCMP2436]|nr:hypothetical protein T492DRAFT_1059812 [Pavlovales sp. CCMP2436]